MGTEINNQRPIVLLPGKYSAYDVERLKKQKIWREVDIYKNQLQELLEIRYPSNNASERDKKNLGMNGVLSPIDAWVYYPWSGILLHCVGPNELFELRTNRNKNLITSEEQTKLHNTVIGVAGMSVGAGIAIGAVYSGIAKNLKLADFDELETANLNRVRESLPNIGLAKVDLASQSIWELDPFSQIQTFPKGLNKDNIDEFFNDPSLSIIIDEIDDFKMKVLLRIKAKQNKLPLLMFTSLGDNILVDIERYDLSPQPEIFNGAIGNVADNILKNEYISPEDIKRYAVQIVGVKYIPTRALETLIHIGKTLVGRPQLYSTIAVDSGLAAYLIRQILLGSDIKSDRYFIKFSELFKFDSNEFGGNGKRGVILKKLMEKS